MVVSFSKHTGQFSSFIYYGCDIYLAALNAVCVLFVGAHGGQKKRADDARCAFTAWRARGGDAERGGGPPHDRHAASDHYRPIPHPVVMLGYFLLFFGACFLFFVFLIRMRKSAPLLFVRY